MKRILLFLMLFPALALAQSGGRTAYVGNPLYGAHVDTIKAGSTTDTSVSNVGINSISLRTDKYILGLQTQVNGTMKYSDTTANKIPSYAWTVGQLSGKQGTITVADLFSFGANHLGLYYEPPLFDDAGGYLAMHKATAHVQGFLDSTDWVTFNNKLSSVDTTHFLHFSDTTNGKIASRYWVNSNFVPYGGATGNINLNGVTISNVSSTTITNFLPSQTGYNGYSYITNGTTAGWGQVTDNFISFTDNTINNVSTSAHGYAPKAPNDSTKFLWGKDGTWHSLYISNAVRHLHPRHLPEQLLPHWARVRFVLLRAVYYRQQQAIQSAMRRRYSVRWIRHQSFNSFMPVGWIRLRQAILFL